MTYCVGIMIDSGLISVGMPIDLVCYERGSLQVRMQRRFAPGDAYFEALGARWSEGTRSLFRTLPELEWHE